MPLIEAALAFAITMLALSLIVSSFVEVIHRAFKMRENGLEYMLKQLFDQVLVKYAQPLANAVRDEAEKAIKNNPKLKDDKALKKIMAAPYEAVRDSFVKQMTTNRAPVGLKPDPTLAVAPAAGAKEPGLRLGNMWGGRRVTQLTPTDFMERLGSIDIGDRIKEATTAGVAIAPHAALKDVAQKFLTIDVSHEIAAAATATDSDKAAANAALLDSIVTKLGNINIDEEAKKAAAAAGKVAADTLDTVLKDIAQKFDGFGKDAASYFEGRARFMSVMVAIVLAFAVHVDAVDLFKTYLRDPNARAKVIEQSQAVTAQYKAAQEAADALRKLAPKPDATLTPEEAKKLEDAKKAAEASKTPAEKIRDREEAKKQKEEEAKKAADIKKQVDDLEKDAQTAIANTKATIKQYADLGVPLGWNDDRRKVANMKMLVWTCEELKDEQAAWVTWWRAWRECKPDDKKDDATAKQPKDLQHVNQYVNAWIEVPWTLNAWCYLILGGLLIGLGSPFWFDAVTSLTSLRSAVGGTAGSASQPAAPAAADAGKAQPVTPVGAFRVANDTLNA
jgi:hypothetical protein